MTRDSVKKKGKKGNAVVNSTKLEEGTIVCSRIVTCDIPSPRVYASMTPINRYEIIVFGGEQQQGTDITMQDQTYRYNAKKDRWSEIISTTKPPPRCSHSCTVYTDGLYMFGGEYYNGEKYIHLNDMWRLDLQTFEWQMISASGKIPSRRSGHKIITLRKHILLFGGFSTTSADPIYFKDMHIFDPRVAKWITPRFQNTLSPSPSARGGFGLVYIEEVSAAYLYGGFRVENGMGNCLEDMWKLSIEMDEAASQPIFSWDLVRQKSPIIPRMAFVLIPMKKRLVLFGGVSDDTSESGVKTLARNDFYIFDVTLRKWTTLECESNSAIPCPRMKPNMCLLDKRMYLWSGVLESKDGEIIMDDFWEISYQKEVTQSAKLLYCKAIKPLSIDTSTLQFEFIRESESSSDSDGMEDTDFESTSVTTAEDTEIEADVESVSISHLISKMREQFDLQEDPPAIPATMQLREYYENTKSYWTYEVQQDEDALSPKAVSKRAFELCKVWYRICRTDVVNPSKNS